MDLVRRLRLAFVVWLAIVGVDFLLNAAIFARLYTGNETFMLPPLDAFRRIPFGYLAFLILALGAVELCDRLGARRTADGLRVGAVAGMVVAASWGLGLYSIVTASALSVLALSGIWAVLLIVAAGVAAAGLARSSLRGLAIRVLGADLLCVVAGVVLQSLD